MSPEPTDIHAWPPDVPRVSPSLLPDAMTGACYEVKFLVTPEQAGGVTEYITPHLHRDPHAGDDRGGAYRVQSLYLDTPAFDVYYRSEGYRRQKLRLRRYEEEPVLYLERKIRTGAQVRKERTRVGMEALARLAAGESATEWPGSWFQHCLMEQQLVPRALIRYERSAFMGVGENGPVRVTLDQQIACVPVSEYRLDTPSRETPLLAGQVVLELKFRVAMPTLFKCLVRDLDLTPCDVSKYRQGVEACALVPGLQEPPDA
ncbi:MAG: polyphosphate polymerase domain-containing protein [Chloroherpetonaceae bacterium]|nr:polyphosphate polymerase domain-containing protein [Chthonomonadaceae bacterium]MDW8207778.1 polyphosphate polymerase domain-containing protein [Chloroherpetonaceae bacterium]